MEPSLVRNGDEACREWLVWRGLNGALRAFDADVSSVPSLAVDRLAETIFGGLCTPAGL